ncbi:MAG: tetratricopeptide repeat protein [Oscillatoriaceae cyanobacterium Prado104]|jgi:tetratricopeptide (TPR) repeat protein/GT2 family glycosyltransferase/spore maturation protein CgeB|nr:tetratricopeptide repeat protein [Oscillatoriaceae cyanobacterium Prado104]
MNSEANNVIEFPLHKHSDSAIAQTSKSKLSLAPACALKRENLEFKESDKKNSAPARSKVNADYNYAKPHYSLGKAFAKKGEWEQAISSYRQALALDYHSAEIYQSLGEALVKNGEFDEAVTVYQKAVEIQPDLWEVHHNLGDIWQGKGRLNEAVTAYRLAIEFNPKFSWSHNNLGDILIKQEKWAEAVSAYQRAIELNPDFHWSHYNLADACVKLEQWEEAIAAYRQAMQIQPDLPQIEEKLNGALHQQVKSHLELAFYHYLQAIERDRTDTDSFQKALEIRPNYAELYLGLGNAWAAKNQQQKAIAAYQQAIAIAPNLTEANCRLQELGRETEPIETEFSFEGFIDLADRNFVFGWVRNIDRPDRTVSVDVFVNQNFVGTCVANKFRQDLAEHFNNRGCYGFFMEIGNFLPRHHETIEISIKIAKTDLHLTGSPAQLSVGCAGKRHKNLSGISPRSSLDRLLYRQPIDLPKSNSLTVPELAITLIIVNRNGAQLLAKFFQAFSQYNSYRNLEILVVDNASEDDSLKTCEDWQKILPIKTLKLPYNYSFAKANNLAVSQTKSPLILFLNNDIIFDGDIIPKLVKIMQDDRVGVAGIKLLDEIESDRPLTATQTQHLGIGFNFDEPNLPFRPFDLRYAPESLDISNLPWRVPAVTGAAMICRREDFLAVGKFHEGYFYGYEDVDFCLSMTQILGKEIVCANNLTALHHRGFTRFKQKPEFKQRMANNRHLLESRFGYFARRQHLSDFFNKDSAWNSHPLRVGFAVTEADMSSATGDYFTAFELGEQLVREFGWDVFYLAKESDWYDAAGLDVIIVMRDDYDLRSIKNAKHSLIKVIWARNWFERLASQEWVGDYDCVWCSSEKATAYLQQKLSKPVSLVRIATNLERFQKQTFDVKFSSDYCFTGSYWDAPREIIEFLEPQNLPFKFALYGSHWEKIDKFKPWYKGALPYTEMSQVYAATKIVIDDANSVTKEWGSVNSRVFDAIAAGALAITNGKIGSQEVFGGLLPVYDSQESLEQLLREYLTDEPKRLALVGKLQKIVRKQHNYQERARSVYQALQDKMSLTFRIAIKIGVPNLAVAQEWGDYHFALGMKRAFERQGHSVRIDILPEWETPKGNGDDVVIVLRGLSSYQPKPHHINLMWNISHPDRVPLQEYEKYDRVFVASQQYADKLSKQVKVPVQSLLQCTDPDLFHPDLEGDRDVGDVLFVGNSRQTYRQIVRDAVESGIDVNVYGAGWESFLPAGYLKGEHIPNNVLNRYYSHCSVLLNDHWQTMSQNGFISNRLFDAAACGATIISDKIAGLSEIFGDRVVTYSDAKELPKLIQNCSQQRAQNWQQRLDFSQYIRENHSFDRRVGEILQVIQHLNEEKMQKVKINSQQLLSVTTTSVVFANKRRSQAIFQGVFSKNLLQNSNFAAGKNLDSLSENALLPNWKLGIRPTWKLNADLVKLSHAPAKGEPVNSETVLYLQLQEAAQQKPRSYLRQVVEISERPAHAILNASLQLCLRNSHRPILILILFADKELTQKVYQESIPVGNSSGWSTADLSIDLPKVAPEAPEKLYAVFHLELPANQGGELWLSSASLTVADGSIGFEPLHFCFVPFGDYAKASARLRVWKLVECLKNAGHRVTIGHADDCDVYVYQKVRPFDKIQQIKNRDALIVYDFDDNYSLPTQGTQDDLIAFMNSADLVTVGSKYLGEFAGKYHPNIFVLENPVDIISETVERQPRAELKRIGWFGAPEGALQLEIVNIDEPITTVTKGGNIEFDIYTVDRILTEFDVLLFPLEPTEWNLAKNANRLIKAVALGIPVLATATPEHIKVAGELGLSEQFLVEYRGDWKAKLANMRANFASVQAEILQARQRALELYSTESITKNWFEHLVKTPKRWMQQPISKNISESLHPSATGRSTSQVAVLLYDYLLSGNFNLTVEESEVSWSDFGTKYAIAAAPYNLCAATAQKANFQYFYPQVDYFEFFQHFQEVVSQVKEEWILFVSGGYVLSQGIYAELDKHLQAASPESILVINSNSYGCVSDTQTVSGTDLIQSIWKRVSPGVMLVHRDWVKQYLSKIPRFLNYWTWYLLLQALREKPTQYRCTTVPAALRKVPVQTVNLSSAYAKWLERNNPQAAAEIPNLEDQWYRITYDISTEIMSEFADLLPNALAYGMEKLDVTYRQKERQK